jgi:hypothetical protein
MSHELVLHESLSHSAPYTREHHAGLVKPSGVRQTAIGTPDGTGAVLRCSPNDHGPRLGHRPLPVYP